MGCLSIRLNRRGGMDASLERIGGILADVSRDGGAEVSAERYGGICATASRTGGMEVRPIDVQWVDVDLSANYDIIYPHDWFIE